MLNSVLLYSLRRYPTKYVSAKLQFKNKGYALTQLTITDWR